MYIAESLAPPKSLGTIIDSYKTFYSRATNKEYYQRLLRTGEWKKVAIYGLEAYGIFTIGEMVSREGERTGDAKSEAFIDKYSHARMHTPSQTQIGRRSLVGYDLEKRGHAHH